MFLLLVNLGFIDGQRLTDGKPVTIRIIFGLLYSTAIKIVETLLR